MPNYQLYAVRYTYNGAAGTFFHSGGSKTGANIALYDDRGANRIVGRLKGYGYADVEKVPVAFGFTQEQADENADDAMFLSCLYSNGVDNWHGYEYAQDDYQKLNGGDDE